jgi:aldehyde dehydrogenase (NAD+)
MLYRNFIGGEFHDASNATDNINPSNTNDVIAQFASGTRADADAAVAAAKAAFPAWARSTPQQRYDVLKTASDEIFARKEELGRILAREEGKTLAEGIGEATRAGQVLAFFAGEALRLNGEAVPSVRPGVGVEVTREPVGVVGMITPWNFPIAIPAWKIAPALAYGNTVVLKPADLVPHSRRPAEGRAQPRHGQGLGRGSGAAGEPGRRGDHLYGLGQYRPAGGCGLRRGLAHEEGAARNGRQEPARRAR